jgi:hypothetical protein
MAELARRAAGTGEKGDAGPEGPQGPEGPLGPKGDPGAVTSLEDVPCDTGSLDKPDGRISISVAESGLMTLTWRSASTNPALTVNLAEGPQVCTSVLGNLFCFNPQFDAQEVDAGGAQVIDGFRCIATTPTTREARRVGRSGSALVRRSA